MLQYHLTGIINFDGEYDEGCSSTAIRDGRDNIVLAEFFENNLDKKEVYIRYYITDEYLPTEKIEENFIKKISGTVNATIYPVYSDITGYLWTEENIKINGHNLFEEINNYEGKYLDMVIEVKDK